MRTEVKMNEGWHGVALSFDSIACAGGSYLEIHFGEDLTYLSDCDMVVCELPEDDVLQFRDLDCREVCDILSAQVLHSQGNLAKRFYFHCRDGVVMYNEKHDCWQIEDIRGALTMQQGEAPSDVNQTLDSRTARYGEFVTHAVLSQGLCDVMHTASGWDHLAADQKEALEMIQHKIARILNGDPNYLDNWHDLQGYARLVEKRLEKGVQDAR